MTTPHRIYPNRNEVAQEYTHLVKQFVETRYPREEYIKCLFDLYEVNPIDNSVTHMEKIYYPTKDGYIHLLVALLTYPDITFQDLPMYIPKEVYDHMLVGLCFPRFQHICKLSIHPRHHNPIAVEMTTLQQDAREIAGEDMYSFQLPPSLQEKVFHEQYGFNEKILKIIVAFDPKGRFIFSDDKTAVRALYGHSFKIETDELPTLPPTVLYHGTAEKNLASILEKGILPMSRAKVHLSSSIKTAEHVGIRHGRPIVLEINSAAMAADGYVFYKITNDVWQTDYIPAKYITNTIIP